MTLGPFVIDLPGGSGKRRSPLIDIPSAGDSVEEGPVLVDIKIVGPDGYPETTVYLPDGLKGREWALPNQRRLVDGLQQVFNRYRNNKYKGFDHTKALELMADFYVDLVFDMIGNRTINISTIIDQDPYRHGIDATRVVGPDGHDIPVPLEALQPFDALKEWSMTTRLSSRTPEYFVIQRITMSQHFLSFWPTLLKAAEHRTMLLAENPIPRNSENCRRQIRALLFSERRFRSDGAGFM